MLLYQSDSFFERSLSFEVLDDFLVSDGLESWAVCPIFRYIVSYFFEESVLEHICYTSIDLAVKSFPIFWTICIGREK